MNFEQLRYIVKVAKSGSILHAAKSLHITQSALSQAITKIENGLNVQIFNRSSAGTIPTELGEKIVKQSIIILEQYAELKQIANQNKTEQFRIGTVPNSLNYLPKTLTPFKRENPATIIKIVEDDSINILHSILQGELDIGLIAISEIEEAKFTENIMFHTLFYDKLKVAASTKSLAALKNEISIEEILNYPLVIFDHEQIWRFVRHLESEYGPTNIIFSSSNIDMIQQTILENLAITIAPAYIIEKSCDKLSTVTTSLDIADLDSKDGLALAWEKGAENEGAIKKFLNSQNLSALKLSMR